MSRDCSHCKGSGICQACNGAGEGPAIVDGKTVWADCKYCNGTGRCGICGGKGVLG